ncbi:efflux RND transporter periplasmic adaptor subunit [Micromonospora sp. R77]|uniref:efflux RND transporter periplasmic adaptor subunit n=1 Tax=Micromonospora sp. R77 TaxID=2925836 RepID=UPI001F60CE7B|nr:efflux RND transporter periplasmic adaptor subunit [Micromonospora sp. R77]MCI4061415.1 efflux RND transporter periplasmic adaptor subunit [Micromonospora sp. R77]
MAAHTAPTIGAILRRPAGPDRFPTIFSEDRLMSPTKRFWGYGALALVLAGSGAAVWATTGGRTGTNASPAATAQPLQTVTVVRTDLSSGKPLPGTIGYGAARPLKAADGGVITWLPAVGRVIERGRPVYRIDDRPVPLFYGEVPLYRPLDRRGLVGRDVSVIARNLTALGYRIGAQPRAGSVIQPAAAAPTPALPASTAPAPHASAAPSAPVTVQRGEAVLTRSLITAIKSWQRDLHRPETGVVGRGDVVVQSGPIRVAALTAQIGDVAGDELMTITGATKVISVPAEVGDAGTTQRGDTVEVTMPDGTSVPGRVASIGTTAVVDPTGGDPNAAPTITITVAFVRAADAARLDSAAVEVDFVAEVREDVLAVPVGALLALHEGGYAVQVSGGGLVPVTTGLIARGMVEVESDGLSEGTRVVTTS